MNTIIPHSSRFTQKTGTWELCPSPLCPSKISTAMRDRTETRSSHTHNPRLLTLNAPRLSLFCLITPLSSPLWGRYGACKAVD